MLSPFVKNPYNNKQEQYEVFNYIVIYLNHGHNRKSL